MNKYNPWEDIPVSRQFLCEESNKYNFWRYKQPTKNGYNFSFLFELKTLGLICELCLRACGLRDGTWQSDGRDELEEARRRRMVCG